MSKYDKKCYLCGKLFNIYEGEGWGESYMKDGAMLPSTRYVCNKCRKERGNEKSNS